MICNRVTVDVSGKISPQEQDRAKSRVFYQELRNIHSFLLVLS